jgi:hypothetical protein
MKYLLAICFFWPVLVAVGGLVVYAVFWLALSAAGLLLKLLLLVTWAG